MAGVIPAIKTPNLATSLNGSLAIPYRFEFGALTQLALDLTQEVEFNQVDFLQSVYIDNADNSANFDLIFYGATYPQRIRARPYSQGWYPISWPKGSCKMIAQTQAGANVNCIFANYAMPYYQDSPADGVAVVPALQNVALAPLAFGGAGNQQLVGGVGGQSVKFYRGMFTVDQPVILKWTDGPGGANLFAAQLTAGGSVTFQVSGVSWFATGNGNALTLNSSGAVNVYGGFGYVQS